MIFEKKFLCMLFVLEPAEGAHYTDLVRNDDKDDELDYIYHITVQDQH